MIAFRAGWLLALTAAALLQHTAVAAQAAPLQAPQSLTAVAGSSQGRIDLTWNDPNTGAHSVSIERSTSATTGFVRIASVDRTVRTYQNTGLVGFTTYYYRLAAVASNGNVSAYSNTASARTLDATLPNVPTGLVLSSVTCSQLNLNWSASSDTGGSGLKGYNVYRNGVFVKQVLAPATSTSDSGLSPSTTYSYAVSAIDNAGNQSAVSTSVRTTTPSCSDTTVPSVPGNLTVSALSCSQMNLAWTAATDTGGSGLKGYNIYRNGVFLKQVLAPATSTSDSGLTASTSYSYAISAVDNASNQSTKTPAVSRTTPSCTDTVAPSVPASISATAMTCNQLNLNWSASTDTGGSGLKGYNVYRGGVFLKQVLAPATSTTDTGLVGSTAYSYTVSAIDNAGNQSTRSSVAMTSTPACSTDATKPSTPAGLRAWAASCNQIGLTWSAATDSGGSGLRGYRIYRDNVFVTEVTGTSTLDTVSDATRTYSYTVTAIDYAGNQSAPSTLASASLGGLVSFKSQVTYTTGSGPYSVAIGDVNGDGIADLVVANNSGNSVSVLLGRGSGTFSSHVTYATGTSPRSVALGDVNRDGRLDIVTANTGSNTVSVLLGRGDGTFQGQAQYSTGPSPTAVVLGDLNRDGTLDVVVTNFGSATISVLLGNGNGSFQTQSTFATGTYPMALAVADLDRDGDLDVVTANSSTNDISVLRGQGNGTFLPQVRYATGTTPKSVAIGDLNGDGVPDLAVANYGNATLSVLLGRGDATFQALTPQTIYGGPASLAIGRPNRDGFADLAITSQSGNLVTVYAGTGSGTFQASGSTPATGTGPVFVTVGDLTRDGGSDLVTANFSSNTVSVILNACE